MNVFLISKKNRCANNFLLDILNVYLVLSLLEVLVVLRDRTKLQEARQALKPVFIVAELCNIVVHYHNLESLELHD